MPYRKLWHFEEVKVSIQLVTLSYFEAFKYNDLSFHGNFPKASVLEHTRTGCCKCPLVFKPEIQCPPTHTLEKKKKKSMNYLKWKTAKYITEFKRQSWARWSHFMLHQYVSIILHVNKAPESGNIWVSKQVNLFHSWGAGACVWCSGACLEI